MSFSLNVTGGFVSKSFLKEICYYNITSFSRKVVDGHRININVYPHNMTQILISNFSIYPIDTHSCCFLSSTNSNWTKILQADHQPVINWENKASSGFENWNSQSALDCSALSWPELKIANKAYRELNCPIFVTIHINVSRRNGNQWELGNEIDCTIRVMVVYSISSEQYLVNTRKPRRMCRSSPSRNSGLSAGGVLCSVWSEHFTMTVLHDISARYQILRKWKWRDQ
jgi:hypothetical protein